LRETTRENLQEIHGKPSAPGFTATGACSSVLDSLQLAVFEDVRQKSCAGFELEFGFFPNLFERCIEHYWNEGMARGNFISEEAFYREAIRKVFGMPQANVEEQEAWEEACLAAGPCLYSEDFCIVSDRPGQYLLDEHGRPHSETGPAIRWRDGTHAYFWHGADILPESWRLLSQPENITLAAIKEEENIERRRLLIEAYGVKRFIEEGGATVRDELPADHPLEGLRTARLLYEGRGAEPILYIDLLNSTPEAGGSRKRYILRVDPNAYHGLTRRNTHAAAASTWRNADGSLVFENWRDYKPCLES
jgi:hypothetical protein